MSFPAMKKTVLAFSRVTPEMVEHLQLDFNVIVPNPKQGDINAQFNEALPHAHGFLFGAASESCGRNGHHREPQSIPLERDQI